MSELFTLRAAKPEDKQLIDVYTYHEGMDFVPGLEGITVAVNADDLPVGFIRIKKDRAGIANIYPIVINAQWRGYGVGKRLVEDALETYGELRLVSRGSAYGFYKSLGFEECDWSLIDPDAAEDCPSCTMRDECDPQPMRKLVR